MKKDRVQKRPCCLYRHFDADGILLYVGISLSAIQRTSNHRYRSEWFDRVAIIKVQHFASKREAELAEQIAIKTESPLFNVSGADPFSAAAAIIRRRMIRDKISSSDLRDSVFVSQSNRVPIRTF